MKVAQKVEVKRGSSGEKENRWGSSGRIEFPIARGKNDKGTKRGCSNQFKNMPKKFERRRDDGDALQLNLRQDCGIPIGKSLSRSIRLNHAQ